MRFQLLVSHPPKIHNLLLLNLLYMYSRVANLYLTGITKTGPGEDRRAYFTLPISLSFMMMEKQRLSFTLILVRVSTWTLIASLQPHPGLPSWNGKTGRVVFLKAQYWGLFCVTYLVIWVMSWNAF